MVEWTEQDLADFLSGEGESNEFPLLLKDNTVVVVRGGDPADVLISTFLIGLLDKFGGEVTLPNPKNPKFPLTVKSSDLTISHYLNAVANPSAIAFAIRALEGVKPALANHLRRLLRRPLLRDLDRQVQEILRV